MLPTTRLAACITLSLCLLAIGSPSHGRQAAGETAPAFAAGEITAPADAESPGTRIAAPDAASSPDPTEPPLPEPPMMPGWPQTMGVHPNYSPVGVVLADVDDDDDLELLAGSTDNQFYVWNHDGTLLPGWPVNLGAQIQSKAAAADLDGDGDLEIVISVKNGQLHVRHHDGTSMGGWPRPSGVSYGFVAPSIYDLDGDGTPEIMIGGGSQVRVWRADGSSFPGFPQSTAGNITGTCAIGDITGDGSPEIVAVSLAGTLEAFQIDGTVPAGWPVSFGLSNSWAAPSIGDLDHDGDNEALVVGYAFGSYTRIFAYNGDGSLVAGFPITYPSIQTYSCPVIGDVDGDDDLELFNAGKINGPSFYAWDHTGALLPGWPVTADANMEGSVILVDFDDISGQEAAIGDNWNPGLIFGRNLDGTLAADFPINKPGASGPNAPEVADVDGDGDLDMAMTTATGDVGLWDFATSYDPSQIEWGGLFHDRWNTNQHGFVVDGNPAAVTDATTRERLRLDPARPNPSGAGMRTISFTTPREAAVRLLVHDATGSTVRLLLDRSLPAGVHTIRWDGKDDSGRAVAQGVYYLRLLEPDGVRSGRLVVVR